MKWMLAIWLLAGLAQAEPIKHRFLAVDEARSQLHYVNEHDASKDWTIKFPNRYRDVQLLENNRVLVCTYTGYEEYDFETQQKVKSVSDPKFNKTDTVIRLPNGHTILGCNVAKQQGGGVRFFELDAKDAVVRQVTFPKFYTLRLARLGADGTLLFGCDNRVIMGQWDGTYREFTTAGEKRHIYEVEELSNGNFRISSGYGATLEEWTKSGEKVRIICGGTPPEGITYRFFGRANQLENGHWVVSNWMGHGDQDSRNGPQLVEFNAAGEVVWTWHDADRSGSTHGSIIID